MTTKLEQAARHALEALDAMLTHMGMDEDEWTKPTFDQARVAITALREALDHIAGVGKVIPRFIPVGIVNDHHSIDWMEEIVEDQAPIGAILYALQDGAGRNVSFADKTVCICGDIYPADSFGAGFIAATGRCQNCCAAEQAEQEPVAEILVNDKDVIVLWHKTARQLGHQAKLYAAPVSAKREWVDLTDDEIGAVMDFGYATDSELENARAAIAAFKEKNK